MRIIHVLPYLESAGTELHVLDLAKELRHLGHDVHVLAPPGPLAGRFGTEGIPLIHFLSLSEAPIRGAKQVAAAIRQLYRQAPVDIVHVHAGNELLLPVKWAVRGLDDSPSVVFTVHSFFGSAASFDYWLAARLSGTLANGLIAVSKHEGDRLLSRGLKANKLRVVYNGVEAPDKLEDAEKVKIRNQYASKDAVLLGAVGRLEEQKGFDLLIKALRLVRDERTDVSLVIFGSGSQLPELKKLVCELSLTEAVHFAGFHAEASRMIQTADAFVSASRLEGLSLALIEAMASGLPCFVTGIPGNREAVGNDYPWVTSLDPEKMARDLLRFLGERERWPEAVAWLQRRYNRLFTRKAMGAATQQFYLDIVQGRLRNAGN